MSSGNEKSTNQFHSYQKAMVSKDAVRLKSAGKPMFKSSGTRNAWNVPKTTVAVSQSQSRNNSPMHSNGKKYAQTAGAQPKLSDQSEFPSLSPVKPAKPKQNKPKSPSRPKSGKSTKSTDSVNSNGSKGAKSTKSGNSNFKLKPQSNLSKSPNQSQMSQSTSPSKEPSNGTNIGSNSTNSVTKNSPKQVEEDNISTPQKDVRTVDNWDAPVAEQVEQPTPKSQSRFPTNERSGFNNRRGGHNFRDNGMNSMGAMGPMGSAINVDVDSFNRNAGYHDRNFDNFDFDYNRGRGRGRSPNRGGRGSPSRGRGRGGRGPNRGRMDLQGAHWTTSKRFVPDGAIPNFTPEFKPYRRPSYKSFLQAIKDREKRFDDQLAQFQRDRKYYAKKHRKEHMDRLREERERKLLEQQQRELKAQQEAAQKLAAAQHAQNAVRRPNESRSRHFLQQQLYAQQQRGPITLQQQLMTNTLNMSNRPSNSPGLMPINSLNTQLPPHPSALGIRNPTTPPLSSLLNNLSCLSPNPMIAQQSAEGLNTVNAVNTVNIGFKAHNKPNTVNTQLSGKTAPWNPLNGQIGLNGLNNPIPNMMQNNVANINWKSQSTSHSLDNSNTNSRGASPAVNIGQLNGNTATPSPYPSATNTGQSQQGQNQNQTKSSTMTPQAIQSDVNSQIPSISLSDVNKAKLLSKMNHIQFPQQPPLQFGAPPYNQQNIHNPPLLPGMWQPQGQHVPQGPPPEAAGQWNQPGAPYEFQPNSPAPGGRYPEQQQPGAPHWNGGGNGGNGRRPRGQRGQKQWQQNPQTWNQQYY